MAEVDYESLRELRLRVTKPVSLLGEDGIKYLSEEGALTENAKSGILSDRNNLVPFPQTTHQKGWRFQ